MNLTEKALDAINIKGTRLKLAIALDVTEQSIIRMIKDNHENLTKAAAMNIIKKETGFTDKQILTEKIVA